MAVSFGGLASGIDTSSWIEALVATKQASITELEEKKETLQLTTDVLENVKTFFASFKGVLSTITNANLGISSMDIFVQNIVESSNIENVSAIVNTTAEQASYEVNVDQLATETQAASLFYTTNTTTTSQIATMNSLLSTIGIRAGQIGITVGLDERIVTLQANDTIASLLEKLRQIGVTADYDETKGIFSIDVDTNNIREIDELNPTNFKEAFALVNVNYGYSSDTLTLESTTSMVIKATENMKMSLFGLNNGEYIIKYASGEENTYHTIDTENTTFGQFFEELRQYGLLAQFNDDGSIFIASKYGNILQGGIAEALGLFVNDNSFETTAKASSTTWVYANATIDVDLTSTLGELEVFKTGEDNSLVISDSAKNLITTVTTLSQSTTVDDLFKILSEYGINGAIVDNVIELTSDKGNIISGAIADRMEIKSVLTSTDTIKTGQSTGSTSLVSYVASATDYISDCLWDIWDSMSDSDKVIKAYKQTLDHDNNVVTTEEFTFTVVEKNSIVNGSVVSGTTFMDLIYWYNSIQGNATAADYDAYHAVDENGCYICPENSLIKFNENGQLWIDSNDGFYIDNCTIADYLGISKDYHTYTWTQGASTTTVTSSDVITYKISGTDYLSDVLWDNGWSTYTDDQKVISLYQEVLNHDTQKIDKILIDTYTIIEAHSAGEELGGVDVTGDITQNGTTFNDIDNWIKSYDSTASFSVNSDGTIYIDSKDTYTVEGKAITDLGLAISTIKDSWTTGIETTQSSATVTYLVQMTDYIQDTFTATDWANTNKTITLEYTYLDHTTGTTKTQTITPTITVDNNTTFNSLADELAKYNITLSIQNGKITMDSGVTSYNGLDDVILYAKGDIINHFSATDQYTTVTQTWTVGSTTTSSTATIKYAVTFSDYISDTFTSEQWAALSDKDKTLVFKMDILDHTSHTVSTTVVGTYTIDDNTKFEDLRDVLAGYGITLSITDGVIGFDSNVKDEQLVYIECKSNNSEVENILEHFGLTSNTVTQSWTTGIETTQSSASIVYTIRSSDTIYDFLYSGWSGLNKEIVMYQSTIAHDGTSPTQQKNVISSYTVTEKTTFGDLQKWCNDNGMTMNLVNGVLSLSSTCNTIEGGDYYRFLDGDVTRALGISSTDTDSTEYTWTYGVQGSYGSSSEVEYITNLDDYIKDTLSEVWAGIVTSNDDNDRNIVVYQSELNHNSQKVENTVIEGATFVVTDTTSFRDLQTWLSGYGLTLSTDSNGKVTVTSTNNRYIAGTIVDKLSLSNVDSATLTWTYGISSTGEVIEYYAGVDDKIANFFDGSKLYDTDWYESANYTFEGTEIVGYYEDMDGKVAKSTVTLSGTATFGDLITAISTATNGNVTAALSDNGILTITKTNGWTVQDSSNLFEVIGIDPTKTNKAVIIYTVSSSATSTVGVTYTTLVGLNTKGSEITYGDNTSTRPFIETVTQATGLTPATTYNGYTVVGTAQQLVDAMKAGENVILANDINMSEVSPSGAAYISSYSGTLDGNGYKLTNMSAALFNTLSGTVKNLGINGADTDTLNTSSNGALAKIASGAAISNCYVINSTIKGHDAGSLVGTSQGVTTISNCYAKNNTINASSAAGGIIGCITGDDTISGCIVTDCSLTATSGSGGLGAGGICGNIWSSDSSAGSITITGCQVDITADGKYAGGILAAISENKTATISDCLVLSSSSLNGSDYAGGLVGSNIGTAIINNNQVKTESISGGTGSAGAVGYTSDDSTITATNNYYTYSAGLKDVGNLEIGGIEGIWAVSDPNYFDAIDSVTGSQIQSNTVTSSATKRRMFINDVTQKAVNGDYYIINTTVIDGATYDIVTNADQLIMALNDGHNVILANDIDMSDISSSVSSYSGILDGNGYQLSNLSSELINNLTGTVQNIYISNSDASFIHSNDGTISNCSLATSKEICLFNNGTIESCYSRSGTAALCGTNQSGASITGCIVFSGGITCGTSSNRIDYAGGICNTNAGTITSCQVQNTTVSGAYGSSVGGICGSNSGTVTDCLVDSSSELSGYQANVGGLIGYSNGGTISNNQVLTSSITSDSGGTCGGAIGYMETDTTITASNNFYIYAEGLEDIANKGGIEGIWAVSTGNNNYYDAYDSITGSQTQSNTITGSATSSRTFINNVTQKTVNGDYYIINTTIIDGATYDIVTNADQLVTALNGGHNVILANDIDMSAAQTATNNNGTKLYSTIVYTGTIAGNGYELTGMKAALFQSMNGTVKNLGISGAEIDNGSGTTGAIAFGGSGTIINCYVINSTIKGGSCVGSFLGDGNCTINSCFAKNNTLECSGKAGGLIGHVNIGASISDSFVQSCNINGRNGAFGGGGLVGVIESGSLDISNSQALDISICDIMAGGGLIGCAFSSASISLTKCQAYGTSFSNSDIEGAVFGSANQVSVTASDVYYDDSSLDDIGDGSHIDGVYCKTNDNKYYDATNSVTGDSMEFGTVTSSTSTRYFISTVTQQTVAGNYYVTQTTVIDGATYSIVTNADQLVTALNANQNVILANDIDMSEVSTSNAKYVSSYSATLDGNGYELIGMTKCLIETLTGTVKNLGIDGATISIDTAGAALANSIESNAVLDNCYVINSSITIGFEDCFGGALASIAYDNSIIKNCYSYNNNLYSSSSWGVTGGIVGNYSTTGVMSNCISKSNTLSGATYGIGGILGQGMGSTIQNCQSQDNNISGSFQYAGLIAASSPSTISGCLVSGGSITCKNEDGNTSYIGGALGSGAFLMNISNTQVQNVSLSNSTGPVGGMFGDIGSNVTASNCFYTDSSLDDVGDGSHIDGVYCKTNDNKYYDPTNSVDGWNLQVETVVSTSTNVHPFINTVTQKSVSVYATGTNINLAVIDGVTYRIVTNADQLMECMSTGCFNIMLANNIDMSGINTDSAYYCHTYDGILDGNGYELTGMSASLFDTLQGTVKNLGINGTTIDNNGSHNVGIIAKKLSGGTIDNCYVTNSSILFNQDGENYSAGSIVGEISNSAKITSCYAFNNTISVNLSDTIEKLNIGGIAGVSYGGEISNCIVDKNTLNNGSGVGGILGALQGDTVISNCQVKNSNLSSEYNFAHVASVSGILGDTFSTARIEISGCLVDSDTTITSLYGAASGILSAHSNEHTGSVVSVILNNNQVQTTSIEGRDDWLGKYSYSIAHITDDITSVTASDNYYAYKEGLAATDKGDLSGATAVGNGSTPSGYTAMTATTVSGQNITSKQLGLTNITTSTELSECEYSVGDVLSIIADKYTVATYTVTSSSTVGDVMSWVNGLEDKYKITLSLSDGILSATQAGSAFLYGFGNFGLTDTETYTQKSMTVATTTTLSSQSVTSTITTKRYMESGTLLTDLEYSLGDVLSIKADNNDEATYTVTSSSTVGDVMSWVNGLENKYKITLSLTDSKLTAAQTGSAYIAGFEKLGIKDANTYSIQNMTAMSAKSVTSQNVTTNIYGLKDITGDTKLTAIGWAGDDGSTLQVMNDNHGIEAIELKADMTIAQLFNKLAKYGITYSITNGVMTINQSKGYYLQEADGSDFSSLGITANSGDLCETKTYTQTSATSLTSQSITSDVYSKVNISDNTRIAAFWNPCTYGTEEYTMSVYNDGKEVEKFSFTDATTISELFANFAKYGITYSIDNGKLTINQSKGYYLVRNDGLLFSDLGISGYDDTDSLYEKKTYSEQSVTNVTGQSISSYFRASASTKLTDLGFTTGNQKIFTLSKSGDKYLDVTAASTVQDILDLFNGCEASAAMNTGLSYINISNYTYMGTEDVITDVGQLTKLGMSSDLSKYSSVMNATTACGFWNTTQAGATSGGTTPSNMGAPWANMGPEEYVGYIKIDSYNVKNIKLSSIGVTDTSTIVVGHSESDGNGGVKITYTTYTFDKTATLADINNLANVDILNNTDKFKLVSVDNRYFVSSVSDNLKEALHLGDTTYGTSSYESYNGTDNSGNYSDKKTLITTLQNDTTTADLNRIVGMQPNTGGSTGGSFYFDVYTHNNSVYGAEDVTSVRVEWTSSKSLGTLISELNAAGLTTSVNGGQFSIAGSENVYTKISGYDAKYAYFSSIGKKLIGLNDSDTASSKDYTVNLCAQYDYHYQKQGVGAVQDTRINTINANLTLSDFGINSDQSIVITTHTSNIYADKSKLTTITWKTTESLADFLKDLTSERVSTTTVNGVNVVVTTKITATESNGVITLSGDEYNYIGLNNLSDTLNSILNLATEAEGVTYNTVKYKYTHSTCDDSVRQITLGSEMMNSSSTMTATGTGDSGGATGSNRSGRGSTSTYSLRARAAAYAAPSSGSTSGSGTSTIPPIGATLENLNISTDQQVVIAVHKHNTFAQAVTDKITTDDVIEYYTVTWTYGTAATYSTTSASDTTTNSPETISQFIADLAEYGITATINDDGKFEFHGDEYRYVESISTELATALKLQTKENGTYGTSYSYDITYRADSDTTTDYTYVNMRNTKLENFDITENQTMDIVLHTNSTFAQDVTDATLLTQEEAERLGYTWVTSGQELYDALKANSKVCLGGNINLSGMTWSVISSFTGVLDGNGFTISGLNISSNADYVGLIGSNSGTIKNLTISNSTINASSTSGYAGVIAGNNYGTIENVNVTNSKVTGPGYAGGIVGINSGTINLTDAANVNVSAKYAAGFVGVNLGTVKASNATGITVTGTSSSGYAGGFVCVNYLGAVVNDCNVSCNSIGGSVTAANKGAFICSNNSGTLTDCFYDTTKGVAQASVAGVSGVNLSAWADTYVANGNRVENTALTVTVTWTTAQTLQDFENSVNQILAGYSAVFKDELDGLGEGSTNYYSINISTTGEAESLLHGNGGNGLLYIVGNEYTYISTANGAISEELSGAINISNTDVQTSSYNYTVNYRANADNVVDTTYMNARNTTLGNFTINTDQTITLVVHTNNTYAQDFTETVQIDGTGLTTVITRATDTTKTITVTWTASDTTSQDASENKSSAAESLQEFMNKLNWQLALEYDANRVSITPETTGMTYVRIYNPDGSGEFIDSLYYLGTIDNSKYTLKTDSNGNQYYDPNDTEHDVYVKIDPNTGKFSFAGNEYVYIESMDSALAQALRVDTQTKENGTYGTSYEYTVNYSNNSDHVVQDTYVNNLNSQLHNFGIKEDQYITIVTNNNTTYSADTTKNGTVLIDDTSTTHVIKWSAASTITDNMTIASILGDKWADMNKTVSVTQSTTAQTVTANGTTITYQTIKTVGTMVVDDSTTLAELQNWLANYNTTMSIVDDTRVTVTSDATYAAVGDLVTGSNYADRGETLGDLIYKLQNFGLLHDTTCIYDDHNAADNLVTDATKELGDDIYGINVTINDDKTVTLSGNEYTYITGISQGLQNLLKIQGQAGEGSYYTTHTYDIYFNNVGDKTAEATTVLVDGETQVIDGNVSFSTVWVTTTADGTKQTISAQYTDDVNTTLLNYNSRLSNFSIFSDMTMTIETPDGGKSIQIDPDTTVEELKERLFSDYGIDVTIETVNIGGNEVSTGRILFTPTRADEGFYIIGMDKALQNAFKVIVGDSQVAVSVGVDKTGATLYDFVDNTVVVDSEIITGTGTNGVYTTKTVKETLTAAGTFGTDEIYNYSNTSSDVLSYESTVIATKDTALKDLVGYEQGNGILLIHYADGSELDVDVKDSWTLDKLFSVLKDYGVTANIVGGGRVTLISDDGTYVKSVDGGSNLLDALSMANVSITVEGTTSMATRTLFTTVFDAATYFATENTLLSEYDNENYKAAGVLTFKINDKYNSVTILEDDTFGTLISKLQDIGVDAKIELGQLTFTGGFNKIEIVESAGTSNICKTLNLAKSDTLGGYSQTKVSISNTNMDFFGVTEGSLTLYNNGKATVIQVEKGDNFETIQNKFREALGQRVGYDEKGNPIYSENALTLTLDDGYLRISQNGVTNLSIGSSNDTSNFASVFGLTANSNGVIESKSQLSRPVMSTITTTETRKISVANYADPNTTIGTFNILSGSLSVYKDGQKAIIQISSNDTLKDLQDNIRKAFGQDVKGDKDSNINVELEDGIIKIYQNGAKMQIGSNGDTSNFSAITGILSDYNGVAKSTRAFFKVNEDSKVTGADLFRNGNVTTGDFIVGNATITIDNTTTIHDIINQINNDSQSNAVAYWDNVNGEFVIKSKTTGNFYINIESGTSNFTDIMGLTSSTNEDGKVTSMINIDAQNVGKNARINVNGATYTSTNNTFGEDITGIQGLTINVKGLTLGSSVILDVKRDVESLSLAISDVLDAYNTLMENINSTLKTKTGLYNDSALKLLKNQIKAIMTGSAKNSTMFKTLASIGIVTSVATGGISLNSNIFELSLNYEKFAEAFEKDEDAVRTLLIGKYDNDGNVIEEGIFTQIEAILDEALESVGGYFGRTEESLEKEIDKVDSNIVKGNIAIEKYRKKLEMKFMSMDLLVGNMQTQYQVYFGNR